MLQIVIKIMPIQLQVLIKIIYANFKNKMKTDFLWNFEIVSFKGVKYNYKLNIIRKFLYEVNK